MKTQYLCLPLMRSTTTTNATTHTTSSSLSSTNGRVPPASSLMDRFREAVFRLIMVTALSKNTSNSSSSAARPRTSNADHNDYRTHSVRSSYYLNDPYPSEAVADCIEFIKKKSASSSPCDLRLRNDDDVESTRASTVSTDVIIPLPVM